LANGSDGMLRNSRQIDAVVCPGKFMRTRDMDMRRIRRIDADATVLKRYAICLINLVNRKHLKRNVALENLHSCRRETVRDGIPCCESISTHTIGRINRVFTRYSYTIDNVRRTIGHSGPDVILAGANTRAL